MDKRCKTYIMLNIFNKQACKLNGLSELDVLGKLAKNRPRILHVFQFTLDPLNSRYVAPQQKHKHLHVSRCLVS